MPTVKIMAEDGGLGYWLADPEARAIGDLPVSEELRDNLYVWNTRWEQGCSGDAYEDPMGARFDFVAFSNDGFALAKAVKRELPDWTVLYWDEAIEWRYWMTREPRRYDRAAIEYEITAEIARTADE